jgi:ArsR family transcriptional regulator
MDLEAWSACLKVLADPTRVRLLALLEREEADRSPSSPR